MRIVVTISVIFMLVSLTACTTYYVVKDSETGATYYTTELEVVKGGALKLTDQKSSAVVTLQHSDVTQVTSDEYKSGLNVPTPKKIKPILPINRDETNLEEPLQK